MRRVLHTAEYAAALRGLSGDGLTASIAVVADAVKELIPRTDGARTVFLCDEPLRETARRAADAVALSGTKAVVCFIGTDELPDLSGALICDMLFSPDPDEAAEAKRSAWIGTVKSSGCPVVSVAVPAGVDPDTGRVAHETVCARITVAVAGYLPGLFLQEGLDHCGEIRPVGGETRCAEELYRFEASDARRSLPPRKRTAHKGDSGKALLCVGSPKYVGAALLCARACLAAGCGILYTACPQAVRAALSGVPEAIGVPIGDDWREETCAAAIRSLRGMTAVGLGCGVGDGDVSTLIRAALESKAPMVLDADGLNCLSRHSELYGLLHEKTVLTPHPGEMGRLTGLSTEKVLEDPIRVAVRSARSWGCTVLLKGAASVVTDGRRTCIVAEGNAGLGKGGSGDVLTGIITGLLSQGVAPYEAACLGSYLLGTSADRAFALLKERMLRATNVIEALENWNI